MRRLGKAVVYFCSFGAILLSASAFGLEALEAVNVRKAMELAVKNRLEVKLARARTEELRAKILQAASFLLPQVSGTLLQSRTFRQNLKALGFGAFPGLDPLIGPYNTFDARLQVSEDILDLSLIQGMKAARELSHMAKAEEDLAREQVSAAAALSYVEVLRAEKARLTAQAGLDLARKLEVLAKDQHDAGIASGIDVARAETRAAEENLRYLQADAALRDSHTRFNRIVGLPLSTAVQFTDTLRLPEDQLPSLEEAVTSASACRQEIAIAQELLASSQYALDAARWSRAPSLRITGDYGLSGNNPDSDAQPTGKIGAFLNFPLFTSGFILGQVREVEYKKKEAEERLADIREKVEEDVRLSLDRLLTSREQVETSEQAENLAERELEMARDRFSAGAGNNIELIEAQTALARVQDAHVETLARYHSERINFAMALGKISSFHMGDQP